jgi:3-hydroxybutyryl-CoA dehydrogenase
MEIATIGVIGAGTMGHGIAQIAATAGYNVYLNDRDSDILASAKHNISASLAKLVQKKQLTCSAGKKTMDRISFIKNLGEFRKIDLLIEAIVEKEELKIQLYKLLDAILRPHCILAPNTSSISITRLSLAAPNRANKFVGMHFMNPPQLVPLLELICGDHTSQETASIARKVAMQMNRDPIIESKDRAGFIVNRILMSSIREACLLIEEGVASPQDVDKSALLGVGSSRSMPILQLADLIGLDVVSNVLKVFEKDLGPQYAPPKLLEQMVEEGHLGRKTGRGFFEYT